MSRIYQVALQSTLWEEIQASHQIVFHLRDENHGLEPQLKSHLALVLKEAGWTKCAPDLWSTSWPPHFDLSWNLSTAQVIIRSTLEKSLLREVKVWGQGVSLREARRDASRQLQNLDFEKKAHTQQLREKWSRLIQQELLEQRELLRKKIHLLLKEAHFLWLQDHLASLGEIIETQSSVSGNEHTLVLHLKVQ